MTSVWYVGRYGKRQLSVGDWAQLGVITSMPSEWNLDNGWSIPESQFTTQQLMVLSSLPGFAVNSPDGPRILSGAESFAPSSPYSIYFEKMAKLYDQFKTDTAVKPFYASNFNPKEVILTSNNFTHVATAGVTTPASPFVTTAPHREVQIAAFGIRLVYTNTKTSAAPGVDSDNTGSITFSGGVELNGQNYAVCFAGKNTCILEKGATIVSDTLWIQVNKGDVLWPRTCLQAGTAPNTVTALPDSQALTGKWDVDNKTATDATAMGYTNVLFNDFGPVAIIGVPSDQTKIAPAVVIQGASISRGSTDGVWNTLPIGYAKANPIFSGGGFLARALDGIASCLQLANAADTFTQYNIGKGHYRRQNFVKYCSIAIVGEVTNDLSAYGLSQAQEQLLLTATRNKLTGIQRNITYTIPPYTTTTDQFATVANQTVKATEASRVSYNTWVRDGMPINASGVAVASGTVGSTIYRIGHEKHPFYNFLEVADLCETSRNSGKWAAAERVYSDGAITTGTKTLVCNSAGVTQPPFTLADKGKDVLIAGAGNMSAGSSGIAANTHIATITDVIDSKTITINAALNGNAINTVSGAQVVVLDMTRDGLHPSTNGHKKIAAGIKPKLQEMVA